MTRLSILLVMALSASGLLAQEWNGWWAGGSSGATSGSGNAIALARTPSAGSSAQATTLAYTFDASHTVTSGNTVLLAIASYLSGVGHNYAAGDVTKTAGSATIGTVVLDQATNQMADISGVAIFRVPITGSGTLTLTYNNTTAGGFIFAMGSEWVGFNASPVGTKATSTGTGTSHTSGSISTTSAGIIFYVASEVSGGDFTRTYSDTLLYKVDAGASTYTAINQYKTISSSPNTLTDTTGSDSSAWRVVYVQYITQ